MLVCLFCFSTVDLSFISICLDLQKVPSGFFSNSLICGLFGSQSYFFSYDVFSTKTPNKLQ